MSETERHVAFREAVNNCPICNQHLDFRYETDFLSNQILELAQCEHCKLQIRQEDHKVQ